MPKEKYRIAGLNVLMEAEGELTKTRSEKYKYNFSGSPDFQILGMKSNMERLKSDEGLTEQEAEYVATGSRFYNYLTEFSGFMLHSSAVCFDNKAYLFTADSGTGKSTHTSLWQKYLGDKAFILNDDKPAIRLIDGKFYAAGTPWSGKTDQNENLLIEVAGVAVLKRGTDNKISPLSPATAVLPLLSQTAFPTNYDRIDTLSKLLEQFVENVPIFELYCDISEQAVKTSFEAMTKQKYR